jgi:hypothetical protein
MTSPVVIVFNGGSYGTYLEWCLTTLTGGNEIVHPFNANGNSHNFQGNGLKDIVDWRQYLSSGQQHQFIRTHPKTDKNHSITANMLEIAQDADKIIYLYPDKSRLLLVINNFFYKIWTNWLENAFQYDINPTKIYSNWPVERNTPIDKIPKWIMREFLSYYLMPAWYNQVEWDHSKTWNHPKSLLVTVSDLLFDFETTILKIQKFCKLDYKLSVSDLFEAHRTMLDLQTHIDQDRICQEVLNCVHSQTYSEWPILSLPSEAYIQWELRNQGLEIQCHGLDKFPTNSLQLKELLYPV